MYTARSTFIKLFILLAVLIIGGFLLVYELTIYEVNQKYKNRQSSGGSVPVSTSSDLSKDYVSLKSDEANPQSGGINLSGNISANSVQGSTITSTVQDGTSPLNVASSTLVKNLNADMVDGKHASDFQGALSSGTNSQYLRGDKTWQTLNKSAVGLSNVENTALSAWQGSGAVAILGTVTSGTWSAGSINAAGSITGTALQGTSLNLGSGTITSGAINGQTISSSANFTGTITAASTISTPNVRVALYPNDDTNPDLVNAGGYQPAQSGAANFGSGITEGTVLYNNRQTKIRENGYIENFKMYFTSKPAALTAFYFQVWRKGDSETAWNQVYSENVLSKISGGSINTITLTSPALVHEGDYVAVRWTASSDPGNFMFNAISSVAGSTYTISGSVPGSTSYDFTTGTSGTDYAPINVFMQAPMFVTIGDSIVGGAQDWVSLIDDPSKTKPIYIRESTIAFQLGKSLGWSYQNMGIGGQKIAAIDTRFTDDVVNLKPKFVVINGGINDALHDPENITAFTNSWTSILDKAVNNNITPVVIRILPCQEITCSNAVMQIVDNYNNALTALLASYPTAIVVDGANALGKYRSSGPSGNLWDLRTELTSDGIHYTYAGKGVIAKLVVDALPTKLAVKGHLETGDILVNGRLELFGGTGTRYIEPQRNTSYEQNGANLAVKAGSPSGSQLSSDKNGGNLYLSGGNSTGTGSSNIYLQTTDAGVSGTAENNPTTKMTILGNGNVGVGTVTPNNLIQVAGLINFDNPVTGTFLGYQAGALNTTGYNDTAVGSNALQNNTTGYDNSGLGFGALRNNTTGYKNTANGASSLTANISGYQNTANGFQSLNANTIGYKNAANGTNSLFSNTVGYQNTADGMNALFANTTGYDNVALGYQAGVWNQTGTGNVFIGANAGANEMGSNKLYISNSNTATPLIYGDFSTSQLTFNGSITVTTAAVFQGTLSVTGAATFNGHIITGNSSGSTTIVVGANAGTGATASITGNDTSGTITVTTGTGPAAGVLATVTFAGAYVSAPNVILAPKWNGSTSNGATLQYSTNPSTISFTLNSNNAPAASTAYTYSYMIMQ